MAQPFPWPGEFIVTGIASDGVSADSVIWNVKVSNVIVAAHTPDTLSLSLRRGSTIDFSLDSVRAVEGDELNYAWTLTDLTNLEQRDLGEDESTTVEFLRSGNYQLEGLVWRNDAQDNVVWTIQVRSAILDFSPGELSLTVPVDSSTAFSIVPFNPESDSLRFRWEMDGMELMDTIDRAEIRFAEVGETIVKGILFDGSEGDTIVWNVNVVELGDDSLAVSGRLEFSPTAFGISSISPNPFNGMTTIRFNSGPINRGTAGSLAIYDLAGRVVEEFGVWNADLE